MTGSPVNIGRRALLRGRARALPAAIRPPWSRPDDFTTLCTRCGSCIDACPQAILRVGDGGYPEVDFSRGECSFCGACAQACPEPVFAGAASDARDGVRPWSLVAIIGANCLAAQRVYCRSCGEACPTSAIGFTLAGGGIAHVAVDASSCNGCGACVSVCPAEAVTMMPGEDRLA